MTKAQLIDEIDRLEQRAVTPPKGGDELKRREQELAQKEAQLRVVLDNMPGGLVLADGDLNSVLFNSRYSELHDYPDGLLKVGGSILREVRFQADRGDYGPGDKDDLIEELVATYRKDEAVCYERTMPGGRTLQFNVGPTPDGGYVTIATDITELKRREQELAQKEAQLQVVLDNMPGGLMLADGDLNSVLFNSQYSELHDYPEGLLKVGQSILHEARFQADRGDYGPGDKDDLVERLVATYRKDEAVSYERTMPGGRTLHFNVGPTPDGGYVTIATDITDRKRAEEELLEAKQQAEEASELVAVKN
ncbi:MAG: PAS domain-containing protein, partial [Methyloligellaceae bacterium]